MALLVASGGAALAQDRAPVERMPLDAVLRKLDGQRFDVRGIEYRAPWWVVVLRTPRGSTMTAGFDGRTGEMREDFPVERLPGTIPSDILSAAQVLSALEAAGIGDVQAIRYGGGRFEAEAAGGEVITVDPRSGAIAPRRQ
ncbi:MAG: hypothetical protein AB1918_17420 [Pseudomonadota bacterium]